MPTKPVPGGLSGDAGGPAGPRRGSQGVVPSALDWHKWWKPKRILWWPGRVAETAAAPRAGAAPAASAEFVQRFAEFAGRSKDLSSRYGAAMAALYLIDPAMYPVAVRLAADKSDTVAEAAIIGAAMCRPAGGDLLAAYADLAKDGAISITRRNAALTGLAKTEDPAAVPVFIQVFEDGRLPDKVRAAAARALGKVPAADSVTRMVTVLEGRSAGRDLRIGAAEALGLLMRQDGHSAAAASAIRTLYAKGRLRELHGRQSAVLAFGKADPSAENLAFLQKVLQADSEPGTRACAALALGLLGSATESQRVPIRKALDKRWDRESPAVQACVALAYGLGAFTESRSKLEAWLGSGGSPKARGAAAIALAMLGDPAAVPALHRAARMGGDPGLRADATEALAILGGEPALAVLHQLATGGTAEVRGAALYGLGVARSAKHAPLIEKALSDKSPAVRQGAALALAAWGGEASRDRLLDRAAEEKLPGLRGFTIFAAGLAMAPRPSPVVNRMTDHTPWK